MGFTWSDVLSSKDPELTSKGLGGWEQQTECDHLKTVSVSVSSVVERILPTADSRSSSTSALTDYSAKVFCGNLSSWEGMEGVQSSQSDEDQSLVFEGMRTKFKFLAPQVQRLSGRAKTRVLTDGLIRILEESLPSSEKAKIYFCAIEKSGERHPDLIAAVETEEVAHAITETLGIRRRPKETALEAYKRERDKALKWGAQTLGLQFVRFPAYNSSPVDQALVDQDRELEISTWDKSEVQLLESKRFFWDYVVWNEFLYDEARGLAWRREVSASVAHDQLHRVIVIFCWGRR